MKRQRLRLEALEGREVPAVTVTAGTGLINSGSQEVDILINGTSQAESIKITQNSNQIIIDAVGSTTLTLASTTPTSWVISSSSNQIIIDAVNGGATSALDNLTIKMGGGDDDVSILGVASAKDISVFNGSGNDKLLLGQVIVGDNLTIQDPTPSPFLPPIAGDNDTVVMDEVRVERDALIKFVFGNDRLSCAVSSFAGNLVINGGPGNDAVRFAPGTNTVRSNLLINMHAGNDRVLVEAAAASGSYTLDVTGNTLIHTHVGNDFVEFGSGTASGQSVNLKTTFINTGSGFDTLKIREAIMSLLIGLLGDQDDKVNFGTGVSVGFGSYLDGGLGTDSLTGTAPSGLTVVNIP